MNTLIRFVIVTLTLLQLHSTKADFDCVDKNITSKCPTLECVYDKFFKKKDGTRFCRCKIAIINHPVPENTLTYDLFFRICSQREYNLKELWINDVDLENLDNAIFVRSVNLRILNLKGNKLRLNFSENVTNIRVLDISKNKLNSVDSDSFANFKLLKSINLSHNRLNKVNYCFEKLTNLEEIYLNNNHLLSIHHDELDHLNLTILDLSHNLLTSIDPKFCFFDLREVHLNDNYLSSINTDEVNCLSKIKDPKTRSYVSEHNLWCPLQILDLSSNNITHIDKFNKKFRRITFLNLNNNSLTEKVISCDNLEYLENVNILQLSHNQISHIYNCTFSKLEDLSKLTLSANHLEKIPASAFSALTKLQELNLAVNKIDEIPDGLFDNLRELRKLNISHNRLKIFNVSSLKGNTKITVLDIKYNDLETFDLRQLKNTLPRLRVLDFDNYLIRCEDNIYGDVLEYFEENNVVLKSCKSPKECCGKPAYFKFAISIAVATVVAVLALVGLFFIIRRCLVPSGRNVRIQMMPIIQSPK